jgi:HK97 family phage prohead protease
MSRLVPYIKDAGPTGRKQLVCPFELKDLDDKGHFTGYGSIFDNVDLGGDIVVGPQPFKRFKYTKDKQIRILYQHDTWQPVGKSPIEQEAKGLWLSDAQLVMEMPAAPAAYAGMKSGLLDGLSIGFDILPKGSEWDDETRTRKLFKLELWEVSIVTFGMNPLAKIQSVKAAMNIKTKREFEEFLRDAGWSADAAKKIAAAGFKEDATQQPRDVGSKAVQDLTKKINDLSFGEQRDVAPSGLQGLIDAVGGFKLS